MIHSNPHFDFSKLLIGNLSALSLLLASGFSSGEIIYSNLQNITIPATYDGIYIDVDGVIAPSTSAFTGWDFNPFMGGVYVANNTVFQPGRTTADDMGTLKLFAVDSTVDSGLLLGTGMGGSIDHLGTTFTAGVEGYLGFKLNGADYGWMRVVFTDNTGGAVIKDWAYDDAGASLVAGAVRQEGTNILLSSGFVLATPLVDSGGASNLIKSGAGTTTTLKGSSTYTGVTTVSSGTLELATGAALTNTSSVTVQSGGTLTGEGTIAGATTIQDLGTHSVGVGTGVQTFSNNLTYNTGSNLTWELAKNNDGLGLNGSEYDGIDVSEALIIAAGVTSNLVFNAPGSEVNWNNPFWNSNRKWLVYDNATSATLSSIAIFDTITVSNDSQNQSLTGGSFSWSQTGNNVYLEYTVIPEPSTALLLGSLCLILARQRRRHA